MNCIRLTAALLAGFALARGAERGARPPALFQKYCFECHDSSKSKPGGGINLERLLAAPTVGAQAETWDKVAEMLETSEMPPSDATLFPADAERTAAAAWVRGTLNTYEREHGGEPGRVTVRRLTSGEYAYAIRDLTGLDLDTGIDASSDSVGGEGFTNFGDVQFVQDQSVEHYLEAAKRVAEHAVVGAGPLQFSPHTGRTGEELFALMRINELYATNGFRVVSGEGGRPFGLERYGKAFFVAWYFQHRAALGDPRATLRSIAAKEGIAARFAEHIWSVVQQPQLGYPSNETVARWKALPVPTAGNVSAAIAQARTDCDAIYHQLTTWPSWFFGRGDVAAGGAGDESPLVFDDTSLKVEPTHHYVYPLGNRFGRGRGGPAVAPRGQSTKVFLAFSSLNPTPGVKPVVIARNPRLVVRAVPIPSAAPGEAAAANANAAGARRVPAGPILSTQSLRGLLAPDVVLALGFGTSPDGSAVGPDDFAFTGPVSFEVNPAVTAGQAAELQVDVELGADKNAVVRLVISDRESGPPARGAQARVFLGEPASDGYRIFRAGIAQYVALLPPNSHGEANPADKDPVPRPFDSTYNTPEHDAFILKVKYQRNDRFFAENLVDDADRARLDQAWNDLFSSWPYHDAYLGMLVEHYGLKLKSNKVADLSAAEIAALPAEARPHFTALRAHYDTVTKTELQAEPGHLDDVLAFASRAWRRPLTGDEKKHLRDFYARVRKNNGLEHDDAIRALIARVLVSPAFLYRVETVAARTERPLNNWEMASRLSFFLWSSIPDAELRRAAAAGELTQPARLAQQVKRMTADPKARRLATEFFGQWLGFYRFDQYRGVDSGRFPEFTDEVKNAMYDEAVSTFEYLVRQERPLREILHADYTFLNSPLAKFYGLPTEVNTTGPVTKVDGANALNRGGALRLGAVLTVTSAPLRTSPVKRGDWVLRRVLGTPTPPPPGDAGTLPGDPAAFGGQTLRERLAEHKRNAACANCHLRIDPLGFPLEGFDPVGRMREKYADGHAIDLTGEFADHSTIAGADGLLKYLSSREPQVMKTLAKKMAGYALGRTVLGSDRKLVDELTAAGGNATFSDLAIKIVCSRQFRNHSGMDAEPATESSRASQ
jgi:mono/diheme cytochrome c family protein